MPKCGRCGKRVASDETIGVLDAGDRCYACFNKETADRLGIDFAELVLDPVVVMEADGEPHTFEIRSLLVPTGLELEATETPRAAKAGYRSAVLSDFQADPWELFQKLYAKIRRELAVRHVEQTAHGWQVGREQRLVGRIEWDSASDGRVPLLVVDGRPFTWEEVGRMLMTFEGFTLDARIEDTIELVGDPEPTEEL
jgi:hypothetical protein